MDPGRILLSCGDAKPDGSADVQADAKSHDGSADVQADAVPYHSSAYPSYHAASDSSPAKSSGMLRIVNCYIVSQLLPFCKYSVNSVFYAHTLP